MKIKLLYLHHCGVFGGSSKSLLELLKHLDKDKYSFSVLCPRGSVIDAYDKDNIKTYTVKGFSTFMHSYLGFYRQFRWAILLREMYNFPSTLRALIKYRKVIYDADIIHLNELDLWPVLFLIRKMIKTKPTQKVVMHVRACQQQIHGKWRIKLIRKIMSTMCDRVIAIDKDVYQTLAFKDNCEIIYNSLARDGAYIKKEYKKEYNAERPLNILFIGNMLKQKGILDLIDVAHLCSEKGLNIQFKILGPVLSKQSMKARLLYFLNVQNNVSKLVLEKVDSYQLQNIDFMGFSYSIHTVINACDVICFPSHLEAVGRPVFEGALYGLPSIVALTDPSGDIVKDKISGLCFPASNVDKFFECCEYFYCQPEEVERMGLAAQREAVVKFSPDQNAKKVEKIYEKVLSTGKDLTDEALN